MMKKRKYEAKTGEEWLQHVAAYLYKEYRASDARFCYEDGWLNQDAAEARRIILSLIKTIGDN